MPEGEPHPRLRVGVLTRGKYGERLVEALKEHTPFNVKTSTLPVEVPEFSEDPGSLLASSDLDIVMDVDLLIAYALHTDLALAVIGEAARRGVKSVILPGGIAISPDDIKRARGDSSMEVAVEDICCTLTPSGHGEDIAEFARYLGRPHFRFKVDNGSISEAEVLVGTPCGGSWHVASELIGVLVEDAPRKAALLLQYYPCRATRGGLSWDNGNIHVAAEIMATAVERALRDSLSES